MDATGGRYVDAGQVSYDTAADQVDRIYDDISGCGSCNEQIAYLQEELEQVEEDLAASETWRQLLNHDLRNAINVARGQITLAQETDDDDEYLETAEEHIDRMVRLLERESDARKTQDAQRQQYDTDAQINAIMADCRDEAENAGITLENAADDSYSVTAVSYLQDALGNLVRNGIEHSGADTIWLDAAPADDTEDIIEFHVEDDGDGIPWDTLGIPEHDRKQLFDFGTGSNTGIGLHIVRRAAEESGGYVDVGDAHRAPSGTRFTVAVPRL
ncbi:MAG: HAMP domain-containing sensor histidine kinase [Candidatus Nanohaloarchaea archaeon]|nr:HAMP domain-containing sensor histidine kinase [Candidatus Nanohaloarchaea archaeon]